jgi:hypothetical protein
MSNTYGDCEVCNNPAWMNTTRCSEHPLTNKEGATMENNNSNNTLVNNLLETLATAVAEKLMLEVPDREAIEGMLTRIQQLERYQKYELLEARIEQLERGAGADRAVVAGQELRITKLDNTMDERINELWSKVNRIDGEYVGKDEVPDTDDYVEFDKFRRLEEQVETLENSLSQCKSALVAMRQGLVDIEED